MSCYEMKRIIGHTPAYCFLDYRYRPGFCFVLASTLLLNFDETVWGVIFDIIIQSLI